MLLKMERQLLKSKLLIPPARPSLVERPRLFNLLNEWRNNKLIIVSAPAGYGKTTLLSAWIGRCKCTAAWLTLEAGDNDPTRFVAYLLAALRSIDPALGKDIPESLLSGAASVAESARSHESLLTALLNQIHAIPADFVLVFDDFHLITNQSIGRLLNYLVEHQPPQMHLVIATRADPPLPLARLRGRTQLTELRAADLQFSLDEAAKFLNQVMGLSLAAGEIVALAERTEGWIAGLQMAAVTMRGREDIPAFIEAFAGSNRYILDYLVEEVLQHQSRNVNNFLLKTAILEKMCGDLCDFVVSDDSFSIPRREPDPESQDLATPVFLNDSQSVLEYLESINLFIIPMDDQRAWYRYHRLFSDILKKLLKQTFSDQVPELHLRASEWFWTNGWVSEAIDHAFLAGEHEIAGDLIEQSVEKALMRGEMVTVLGWIDRLPENYLQAHPRLDLYHLVSHIFAGNSQEVIYPLLERVERKHPEFFAEILVMRAYLEIFDMHYQRAEDLARQALEHLPPDTIFFRSAAEWVLSMCRINDDDYLRRAEGLEEMVRKGQSIGSQWFLVGSLTRLAEVRMNLGQTYLARDIYQQALGCSARPDGSLLPAAGLAKIGLGQILMEWYELDEAAAFIKQGIELNLLWHPFSAIEGYASLAVCKTYQGDPTGAQAAIQKAHQLAKAFDVTEIDDLFVALIEAQIKLRLGDKQAILRYLEIEKPALSSSGIFNERILKYEQIVLARSYIDQKQPEKALAILNNLLPEFEQNHRTMLLIELEILKSLALQTCGDIGAAQASFENALVLAEPGGYIRLFVEHGKQVWQMLSRAEARRVCPGHVEKLIRILEKEFPGGVRTVDSGKQPGLIEPLSDRELEVLRLLNSSLTVPEIAAELYISDSTVRSHVKSIYGKLGVHRRLDAIQQAYELHLFGES